MLIFIGVEQQKVGQKTAPVHQRANLTAPPPPVLTNSNQAYRNSSTQIQAVSTNQNVSHTVPASFHPGTPAPGIQQQQPMQPQPQQQQPHFPQVQPQQIYQPHQVYHQQPYVQQPLYSQQQQVQMNQYQQPQPPTQPYQQVGTYNVQQQLQAVQPLPHHVNINNKTSTSNMTVPSTVNPYHMPPPPLPPPPLHYTVQQPVQFQQQQQQQQFYQPQSLPQQTREDRNQKEE